MQHQNKSPRRRTNPLTQAWVTITIRKHPSHNRKEPGIFSTSSRGPARRSHDRRGYDLLGLSAGMFDHTSWHPYLIPPGGTTHAGAAVVRPSRLNGLTI